MLSDIVYTILYYHKKIENQRIFYQLGCEILEIVNRIIRGEYDNHLMPFLWMHGEEKAVIKNYLEKISGCGMKAVCLESRPYEAFLKEQWWSDLSFIVSECERLEMEIWILDDKHFPTGYAAGAVKEKYPYLRKMFLNIHSLDFVGPKKNAGILLKWLKEDRPNIMNVGTEDVELENHMDDKSTEILSVLAARKTGYDQIDEDTIVILPYHKGDEILRWNMPEGEWSVFLLSTTFQGGEAATEGYLNPLQKDATQVLIDTVYEPHYERLKEKFGTVIKGFFSDEPRFGNIKGSDASIGRVRMPLPWKPELEADLAAKAGMTETELLKKLLLLFVGDSAEAHKIRYEYMDLISKMYVENFSNVIGAWCAERGAEYIGHVIEDNNAHARLGYGAGHLFRAMSGQHMSGIDVVLHQLMPRQNKGYFKSFTSAGWDGEFFTYGLAKLGASLGHLDGMKQGRTMCEVFGAYGWGEGLRMMKWIADHMLVNGVNFFVPHAFSMKNFPDPDCPPHFYAHGNDLEFSDMDILSDYINRVASLISGGKHGGNVGLLYHAEAEWSGEYMLFQKPARVMMENQIEFDVVSADMLLNDAMMQKDGFVINEKPFNILIIPYAERLPERLIVKIIELSEHGTDVVFIDDIPEALSENRADGVPLNRLRYTAGICGLQKIPEYLGMSADRLISDRAVPDLRYYHYYHDDGELFVLFNEDLYQDLEVNIVFPIDKPLTGYDPMENRKISFPLEESSYKISLSRGEMVILYTEEMKTSKFFDRESLKEISLLNYFWTVEVGEGCGRPNQRYWEFECLPELEDIPEFKDFSGELIYRTEFSADSKEIMLGIEDPNEVVKVRLNGCDIGRRISYPYRYNLSGHIKTGKNVLEIRVINSLGRYMKDYLSQYMFMEPLGITGDVVLKLY